MSHHLSPVYSSICVMTLMLNMLLPDLFRRPSKFHKKLLDSFPKNYKHQGWWIALLAKTLGVFLVIIHDETIGCLRLGCDSLTCV